ncbi:MAG: hypothetical protein IOD12_14700 [Silvanigrellales bacterium]|nr:hypothetical protein [Silvanigrellales bacterium]
MARFSFSHIVLSATAALGLQSLFIAEARAVSFRVVAGGGYEKLQEEKQEGVEKTPDPLAGYALQALGELGFLDSMPGFSLLAGGGFRYSVLSSKSDGLEYTINPLMAAAEFGAEFSMLPMLRVQGLLGYDHALQGDAKIKGDLGTTRVDEKFEIEDFTRFQISARALVTVAPFVSLGLEPSYFRGSWKLKQKDLFIVETEDFSGFAIKAVAAFTL